MKRPLQQEGADSRKRRDAYSLFSEEFGGGDEIRRVNFTFLRLSLRSAL